MLLFTEPQNLSKLITHLTQKYINVWTIAQNILKLSVLPYKYRKFIAETDGRGGC